MDDWANAMSLDHRPDEENYAGRWCKDSLGGEYVTADDGHSSQQ